MSHDCPAANSVAQYPTVSFSSVALNAATVLETQAIIESGQHFDLLFIDITLMDENEAGLRLAQEAAKRRPGLPVLYTTGRGVTDGMVALFVQRYAFLGKP